jgi:hypothetical protein
LDARHVYAAPTRLRLNHWALAGDWTVKRQAIVLNRAEGRIVARPVAERAPIGCIVCFVTARAAGPIVSRCPSPSPP